MEEYVPVARTIEHGLQVVYGDLWALKETGALDTVCITTNGTVERGSNIMGGGCAHQAAIRWPWLPAFYGRQIEKDGNHVFLIGPAVMFPVKHHVEDPADIDLIVRSARELVTLSDLYGWISVGLPTPGCGLGGLRWEDVGPRLAEVLDERFNVVRLEREYDAAQHSVAAGGIGRSTREFSI
jgi:hypothetical protein